VRVSLRVGARDARLAKLQSCTWIAWPRRKETNSFAAEERSNDPRPYPLTCSTSLHRFDHLVLLQCEGLARVGVIRNMKCRLAHSSSTRLCFIRSPKETRCETPTSRLAWFRDSVPWRNGAWRMAPGSRVVVVVLGVGSGSAPAGWVSLRSLSTTRGNQRPKATYRPTHIATHHTTTPPSPTRSPS
jgi:hypothetical protein